MAMRTANRHTTFRANADDLDEIDRRARARGLSRTRYLIATALDRDPWGSPGLEGLVEQTAALDGRVAALEREMGAVSRSLAILGFEPLNGYLERKEA